MIRVINRSGKFDYVKRELLTLLIKTGYVVAVAE